MGNVTVSPPDDRTTLAFCRVPAHVDGMAPFGFARRRLVPALLLIVLPILPSIVAGQTPARADGSAEQTGGLVGTVVDVIGKPMADVEVYLAKSGRVFRTDSRGIWRIPNPPIGPVVVVARAVGYVPYVREVVVTSAANDSVTLLLRRYPRTLTAVQITANSNAAAADAEVVAERLMQMKVSAGRLYTRAQILEQRPYSLAELIQGVPGIVVRRVDREVIATTTRAGTGSSQVEGQGPCQLQFYINGTPVDNEGALTLDPLNFRSVEVYPQTVLLPGLPSRGDKCGAIVVNMLRR